MSRNTVRRAPTLILLALCIAFPAVAAPLRPHAEQAKPAPQASSAWPALLEKVLQALGLPAPAAGDVQPQNDAGPGMDPIGH